jgi:hypothetical protein
MRVHRTRSLPSEEVTIHDGFPVTTVARTIVDLAGCLRPVELERAVETAERLGLFDLRAVERACARGSGRAGVRVLRALLTTWREPPLARSELEREFQVGCEQRALPLPSFNVMVHGQEVDALWEEQGVVVELDGWEYHRTRAAFERDRARDATLVAAGYRVLRFTWRQLRGHIAWKRLAQALAAPPVKRIAPIRIGGHTTPLAKRRP